MDRRAFLLGSFAAVAAIGATSDPLLESGDEMLRAFLDHDVHVDSLKAARAARRIVSKPIVGYSQVYRAEEAARVVLVEMHDLPHDTLIERHILSAPILSAESSFAEAAAFRRLEDVFALQREIRVWKELAGFHDTRTPTHLYVPSPSRRLFKGDDSIRVEPPIDSDTIVGPSQKGGYVGAAVPDRCEVVVVEAVMYWDQIGDHGFKCVMPDIESRAALFRGEPAKAHLAPVWFDLDGNAHHEQVVSFRLHAGTDSANLIRVAQPGSDDGVLRYVHDGRAYVECWEYLHVWNGDLTFGHKS